MFAAANWDTLLGEHVVFKRVGFPQRFVQNRAANEENEETPRDANDDPGIAWGPGDVFSHLFSFRFQLGTTLQVHLWLCAGQL